MAAIPIVVLILFGGALYALLLLRRGEPGAFPLTGSLYLTEYLFFVRYQLLAGALLFFLPLLSRLAPESLTNLFVIDPRGIALVTFAACLLAWSITYTGRLTWVSTPQHCDLLLDRRLQQELVGTPRFDVEAQKGIPARLMTPLWIALGLLLALPLTVRIVRDSAGEAGGSLGAGALAAAVGGAAATALMFASGPAVRTRLAGRLFGLLARIGQAWPVRVFTIPYDDLTSPRLRGFHLRAMVMFFVFLGLYAVIGFSWPFALAGASRGLPALLYFLLLFIFTTWLLGFLAFQFDKLRLPGVALLLLGLLAWQWAWPSDHVFAVEEPAHGPLPTTNAVLAEWERTRDADTPMVVVAASGGGITAALWSAQVLTGLEEELAKEGRDFRNELALISSVSGGAVGSMLYVDSFAPPGQPPRATGEEIVSRAAASSLEAVAWGFAYPDLWRLVMGKTLGRYDRGWAQERAWARQLTEPGATLGSWAEGVKEGWRPLQVFNVTLQETGQRLLLAPAVASGENPARADLREYLGGVDAGGKDRGGEKDLEVATAARLSATFPYVSPHARRMGPWDESRYRAADGGYYDNSGVVSAIDVLDSYFSSRPRPQNAKRGETAAGDEEQPSPVMPRRVVLVIIRAAPSSETPPDAQASRGDLSTLLFGPVGTLYNMRGAAQADRNRFELAMIANLWKRQHDVELESVEYHLGGLGGQEPLSWKLTEKEIETIRRQWSSRGGT